ncbi:hypothetical protein ACOXXX_06535 [Thalassococcus sp. BH17M4-6]|uniref:hypothetical protein n=1 Tax=Thalassococcus sp. BH17M4-6 TaxID=3413148 RepID=UPI003BBB1DB3
MPDRDSVVLFGVKSPLVVDVEETLIRAGVELVAAVAMDDTSRLLDRSRQVALDDFLDPDFDIGILPCAFAPANRRALVDTAMDIGLILAPALVDPTATLAQSCRRGAGSYVNAGAVIGGATMLGECVLVNRAASIGHHSVIGAYASIGPGATIAGNVRIGADAIVGAGAVILPDRRIGDGAVVAAGSVVRRDVAPGTLVSGNPARVSRLRPHTTPVARNAQE